MNSFFKMSKQLIDPSPFQLKVINRDNLTPCEIMEEI